MNRRGFFAALIGAIAARFAPKLPLSVLSREAITREMLSVLRSNLVVVRTLQPEDYITAGHKIGDTIPVRRPQRFITTGWAPSGMALNAGDSIIFNGNPMQIKDTLTVG